MRATPLLFLLLLAACTPPAFETDSGQLKVADEEVVDLVAADGGPSPFLAGTGLCPTISCAAEGCPTDEDFLACFAQSFTGPVAAGECLSFSEAGVVDWTFTAQECPASAMGWVPVDDHVAIDVLAPEAVEGRLAMSLEEGIEAAEGTEGLRVERPAEWRYADGDTWQLAAGEPVILTPRLRTLATGEPPGVPVAWRDGLVDGGSGVDVSNGEGIGRARTVLDDGQSADFVLDVGGHQIAVGTARGVPASTVKSLELAVIIGESLDGVHSLPYAARAIARDADGALVLGVPVKWRLHGLRMSPGPDGSLPGADYVGFTDECADPGTTFGEQRATLTASLGLLSASTELVWTPRTEAAPNEEWLPHEDCQDACGCASTTAPTSPGVIGGAAVLLAAVTMRRRGAVRP